jgi:imidazoleglycerol-phosphate dehydratase/histidinol-phosphatase
MKQALFIDRDGTILVEPEDEQIDSYSKFQFLPCVIRNLNFIKSKLDFEFVMVSNQDGLGTSSYPYEDFYPTHNLMLDILKGEGVEFDNILIDKSFPNENLPTRKPGTAMLTAYLDGSYDLENSYVIGDRITDALLAKNLGCKAIIITQSEDVKSELENDDRVAIVNSWDRVSELLFAGERIVKVHRKTNETDIDIEINLDGAGKSEISTGIGFFDNMLEQIAKHGSIDLKIAAKGDLNVDEHHTIEDTGIVLGECLLKALGNKRGIERYGYSLPMDDCLCSVALDFGGRAWLIWDAEFKREKIGDMPTEMFFHFFKSLSDASKMNLNINAKGDNEHHKIEGIFKAFARSVKMAVKRDLYKFQLPSSKGML